VEDDIMLLVKDVIAGSGLLASIIDLEKRRKPV